MTEVGGFWHNTDRQMLLEKSILLSTKRRPHLSEPHGVPTAAQNRQHLVHIHSDLLHLFSPPGF